MTIAVADVRVFLPGHGTTDISDADLQAIIDYIEREVNQAALKTYTTSFPCPAGMITNASIIGAAGLALNQIAEAGAESGLSQDRIMIDRETAGRYTSMYKTTLESITKGAYFTVAKPKLRMNSSTYEQ